MVPAPVCEGASPARRAEKLTACHTKNLIAKGTKTDFVSRYQLRLAGGDALRHFPAAANERHLRSLLNDPSSRLSNREFGEFKGKSVRVFKIRERAWKILMSWGKDVPKPVAVDIVAIRQLLPGNAPQ